MTETKAEVLIGVRYKIGDKEDILQDVNYNELKTLLTEWLSNIKQDEIQIIDTLLNVDPDDEEYNDDAWHVQEWIRNLMRPNNLVINDSLAVSCPLFEDYWTVTSNASTVVCLLKFFVENKKKQRQREIDETVVKQFQKGAQMSSDVNIEKTLVPKSSVLAWIEKNRQKKTS